MCHKNVFQGVCLRMERACVATRTAAREARDAAHTDVFARSATRRAAVLVATPNLKNTCHGNARNRPYGGVARRLFGSAKRRSSLLALRPAGSPLGGRAISGIRMRVPCANRPQTSADASALSGDSGGWRNGPPQLASRPAPVRYFTLSRNHFG
ncbi:hypothetical protein L810_3014 [Burkholderia sp. AU4i]|nr:hypothetical protein L810_3014 [Burkholderia sp. AU4i]